MKPMFSFKYNEMPFDIDAACKNGDVYTVDNGVEVCVRVSEYKDFDALEWVLYFENKSESNSGIFSDICDCNILLPLDFPEDKRQGYMPKEGDACIITMNGMVAGDYYWENDKVSASEYGFVREYLDKAPEKTRNLKTLTDVQATK